MVCLGFEPGIKAFYLHKLIRVKKIFSVGPVGVHFSQICRAQL